jgi:hypothetical protein
MDGFAQAQKGKMMSDLISRQAAIDAAIEAINEWGGGWDAEREARDAIKALPSAQSEQHYDEWCTDCKEYDTDKHCCPRWNRVIRQTLKDAQPEPQSPCDLCVHNPPSSMDGKPCCMCVAEPWRGEKTCTKNAK